MKNQIREADMDEINDVMESAMTVRQIREALEFADQDARVFFTCNYGDHGRTQQALPVGDAITDCDSSDLYTTAYSQSGVAQVEERGPDDEPKPEWPEDECFPVVFLNS